MTQNFDVNKELDKVLDMPLDKVAPNAVKRGMSMDEVNKILEQLAIIFCIQPAVATIAASLLLLKGAANSGAPKSMDVAVICPDTKKEITITKNDLQYAASKIVNPVYLRRLAEAMATIIGQYAQKQGISGDIANTIDRRVVARGEPALTQQERAWCNSFNQGIPDINERAGSYRLATLLAEDYTLRFGKQKPGPGKGSAKAAINQDKDKEKETKNLNKPTKEKSPAVKISSETSVDTKDAEVRIG